MTAPATFRTVALFAVASLVALSLTGCRVRHTASVRPYSYDTNYSGPRYELTVGRFSNNSSYLRGVFTGGPDDLANQARELLEAHLARSNRFALREPSIDELDGTDGGGGFMLTGQVTELGPRAAVEGSARGLVHGALSLNVVDIDSSRVLYSVRAEGEHELTSTEAEAFHSTAGYDTAVTAAVLDQALGRAVGKLIEGLERGDWRF